MDFEPTDSTTKWPKCNTNWPMPQKEINIKQPWDYQYSKVSTQLAHLTLTLTLKSVTMQWYASGRWRREVWDPCMFILAREFLNATHFSGRPLGSSAAPQIFLLTLPSYSHSNGPSLYSISYSYKLLTTFPSWWVSAHKHQCTMAIMMVWSESSWTLPDSWTVAFPDQFLCIGLYVWCKFQYWIEVSARGKLQPWQCVRIFMGFSWKLYSSPRQ